MAMRKVFYRPEGIMLSIWHIPERIKNSGDQQEIGLSDREVDDLTEWKVDVIVYMMGEGGNAIHAYS